MYCTDKRRPRFILLAYFAEILNTPLHIFI